MKICTVCGAENDSEHIRCGVCRAVLPETEMISAPIRAFEHKSIKICDRCGNKCDKNAVKCSRCGSFLKGARVCSKVSEIHKAEPLKVCVDSGEKITLTAGQIIGRQYQPKIWDAYTPRALYKIHFVDGNYALENLKNSSFQPVKYGVNYTIGRKKIRFSDNR